MRKIALLLFGRYIKKKIWEYSNASFTIAGNIYEWIIDAPISQWRTRLWCIRHSCGGQCRELYDWLTHKRKIRVQDIGRQGTTSDDPLKELNEEFIAMYNDLQYNTDKYSRKLIEERRRKQPSSGM